MYNAAPSSEHRWEGISARDNARLHNGHVYNIHNYASGRADQAEDREQTERDWRQALRDWLGFLEIDDRREQVQKAHQDTFRWIFEDGNETGFADWLSSGDGIFWIHGKPASGKSTLMKFITDERRLRELLTMWSGDVRFLVASFYFWAAGSQMQRSLIGLYRTLLHQMLRADERMCRVAFPEWQHKFANSEPTIETLTAAMNNILATGKLSNNFFFIIDGLDEYERDSIGKTQLAELMLNLTQSPSVKLLISSRPETPFKIVFQKCPTLRLEQLTRGDIESYVQYMFWSNPSARSICGVEKLSITEITSFIINNAQGVFLWVMLTTRIALDGINNHENVSAVRDCVMRLPPELDQLFTHILMQRIPQTHRQEAFRCLYIAFAWQSAWQSAQWSLSYVILSTAHRASTYDKARSLASLKCSESPQYFFGRLANRCQGLLEKQSPHDHGSVTFLHRTLYDYLKEEKGAQLLLKAELGDKFDVYTAIMAGLICQFREYKQVDAGKTLVPRFFHFNMLAERSTGQARSDLIDAFCRVGNMPRVSLGQHMDEWPDCSLDLESSPLLWVSLGQHMNEWPDCSLDLESSPLLWAAHRGAPRYIQEAIVNGEVPHLSISALLLYYTLMSILSAEVFDPDGVLAKSNLETAILLLNHGVDPTYSVGGSCLWAILLDWIVRMPTDELETEEYDTMSAALRLLVLFTQSTVDLQMCSTIKLSANEGEYTTSEALRKLTLNRPCCRGRPVQACSCARAQAWTSMAMEVLQLLDSPENVTATDDPGNATTTESSQIVIPTGSTQITTSSESLRIIETTRRGITKTKGILGLKKFLPSRRRNHD